MSLFELTYVSKATQLMGMLSFTQILDSAVKWNHTHNLTGVLFYDSGHFCQLIEGQHKDILDVWERIERDNRHIILRQLAIRPIEERSYPNWKLRFHGAEQIAQHFPEMVKVLDGMPQNDNDLLRIMRNIAVE
jgi:hypothetical protein